MCVCVGCTQEYREQQKLYARKSNLQSQRYRCCNIASAYSFPDVTASVRHRWINCFRTRKAGAHDVASSKLPCTLEVCAPGFISESNPNKAPPSISFTWLLFKRASTARWWIFTETDNAQYNHIKITKKNGKDWRSNIWTFNSTVTFLYAPGYVRTGWWTWYENY